MWCRHSLCSWILQMKQKKKRKEKVCTKKIPLINILGHVYLFSSKRPSFLSGGIPSLQLHGESRTWASIAPWKKGWTDIFRDVRHVAGHSLKSIFHWEMKTRQFFTKNGFAKRALVLIGDTHSCALVHHPWPLQAKLQILKPYLRCL